MEQLTHLKLLLSQEGDLSDDLLLLFLKQAESMILNKIYPNGRPNNVGTNGKPVPLTVPSEYEYIQLEISVVLFNKQGAEGQSSHSEGGINRSYLNVDTLLSGVVPYVGVKI